MLRHLKEEDRVEMIIRGLLKQPENKRCINCNSLGPQYVCTTFWTFVCTNCSGVHRDFTHRVKSVSMAKFNEEEIMALQAGGNERARQIYFKDWDPLRNHYPDGRNSHRLREFIKHVYIDRKYAGANSFGKPAMTKLQESVSNSSNQLPSERTRDTFHDRCPLERPSPSPSPRNKGTIFKDIFEERSLRAIQEPPRSSRQKNRVANFEIVDDRFRDDGKVKRYERYSSKESMSPCSVRSTSLPAIRPVKEFLEKQVSLTVGGTHRANDGKDVEASAKGQKAAEAPGPVEKVETLKTIGPKTIEANESGISSKCRKAPDVLLEPTTGGLRMQSRTINTRNLSECESNSEPHCSTAEPQIVQPMSLKTNNQSSSIDPPQMTSLESLLYELSVPMTSPSVGGNSSDTDQHVTYTEAKLLHQGNKAPICESMIPDEKAPNAPNPRDGSTTSGRKELPEELFALNFTSLAARGTGYGTHFQRPVMSAAGFKYPLRPGNPFDISDDALQLQLLPYAAGHPYQMSTPHVPGAYMGQTNNMLFTRPQGLANMGNYNTLASLDPIQQATRTEECSSFGRNFSSPQGRNPFE